MSDPASNLRNLADEYLDTLDSDNSDERYTSDRGFAALGIDGFLEWLSTKGAPETPAEPDPLRTALQNVCAHSAVGSVVYQIAAKAIADSLVKTSSDDPL